MPRRHVILAATLLLAAVAAPLRALDPGAASGWLEVKGQRFALNHAFAALDEDVAAGPGAEKIELLLSDVPVPPPLRNANDKWSFWAAEQAAAGALHGVILYIDPLKKTWNRGQFLSRNGFEFYSQSVSSEELSDFVFMPAAAVAGELAGKAATKKPRRTVEEDEGPWSLDAEFRAVVLQRPAITATLTGAAAAASPQYKIARAYLQAGLAKNLDAIRKTMSADALATLDKMMEKGGTKEALAMFAEEAKETLKLKLAKVIVRGDAAEVEFKGAPGGLVTMSTVLENGAWKIGQ